MKLRPYQEESHEFLDDWWEGKDKSSILSLPCGAGKTFTASSWAAQLVGKGVRIFWAVHREELKKQAIKTFAALGLSVTVWDADNKPKRWSDVNVVMIPSARKLKKKASNKPVLLIVDEGHHKDAPTWEALRDKLEATKVLYLTATPSEVDAGSMPIFKESYEALAEAGYLAKPIYERVLTRIQYAMHTNRSDFTYKSLNKLDTPQRNKIVVQRWVENKDKYGKTLAFVSSVKHAKSLARALKKQHDKVFIITGETSDRDKVLEEFEALPHDEPSFLVSVDIFVEGTDVPSINTIFICRPTLSAVLYVQMIGRASRIVGSKESCYIVDFVDAIKRYEMRSAAILAEALGRTFVGDEISDELDRSDKKKFVKKKLKKDPTIIGMSPEQVDDLVGIAAWKNKYVKRARTIPVYSEDVEKLYAVYTYLHSEVAQGNPFKEAIHQTWSEIGIDTSLTFKLWKEMCWAIIGNFAGFDKAAKFTMEFISEQYKPKKEEMRCYADIAEDTAEFISDLNEEYKDREDEIWERVLDLLENSDSKHLVRPVELYLSPVSYSYRVFTLRANSKCKYPAKGPKYDTPCLTNLGIWKRTLNLRLKEVLDDPHAEIAFTFSR